MASDGEIADVEVSCLRSIAIQLGQPVNDVDTDLSLVRGEFDSDARDLIAQSKKALRTHGMAVRDSVLLLDILVQIVEADGVVQPNETRFIRKIVSDLELDREALRALHPEWATYLAEGILLPEDRIRTFSDTLASQLKIIKKPLSE